MNACGVLKMWEHIQSELVKVSKGMFNKKRKNSEQNCRVLG